MSSETPAHHSSNLESCQVENGTCKDSKNCNKCQKCGGHGTHDVAADEACLDGPPTSVELLRVVLCFAVLLIKVDQQRRQHSKCSTCLQGKKGLASPNQNLLHTPLLHRDHITPPGSHQVNHEGLIPNPSTMAQPTPCDSMGGCPVKKVVW